MTERQTGLAAIADMEGSPHSGNHLPALLLCPDHTVTCMVLW